MDAETRYLVIGFVGQPRNHCGAKQPVIWDSVENRFFKLAGEMPPPSAGDYFDEPDIVDAVSQGKLTRLPSPQTANPDSVVVYVRGTCLDEIGEALPTSVNETRMEWQELSLAGSAESLWAACLPKDIADCWRDTWANRLLEQAHAALVTFRSVSRGLRQLRYEISVAR
jgi:hypothetical protein